MFTSITRRYRRTSTTLAALAATIALASPAVASDFTFNVPVEVANTPSLQSITVSCFVSTQPLGGVYRAAGTNVVGRGTSTVAVNDGSYRGNVVVRIDAGGINPAASGRSYDCRLNAQGVARTGSNYAASSSNFTDVYERATGHTLDRLVTVASGNL